jgi:trimeric autotransporter adhesin
MLKTLHRFFYLFVFCLLTACGGGSGGDTPAPASDPVPPGVQLVSISVGPQDTQVAKGLKHAFEATGVYSDSSKRDLTAQVVWASSDAAVATVDATGLASTLGVGRTQISAALGDVKGNVALQVTGATLLSIDLPAAQLLLAKAVQQNLTATGVFSDNSTDDLTRSVVWQVSDVSVASVSEQGVLKALAPGVTTLSASLNGVVASSRITVSNATLLAIDVTPDAPRISNGTQVALVATGLYSDDSHHDLSTLVTWASSQPTVATVVGSVAKSAQPGNTVLRATLGNVSGSTALTVTAATLVSVQVEPSQAKIAKGTQQTFTATGIYSDNSIQDLTDTVVWRSQDTRIASVSNAGDEGGLAQGLKAGATVVQASVGEVSGLAQLEVTAAELVAIEIDPISPRLAKGIYFRMKATGLFSDNTTQDLTPLVTWQTSNNAVQISNGDRWDGIDWSGIMQAVQEGSTTISATFAGVSQTTSAQVTAATLLWIDISPTTLQLAKGTRHTFAATGVYSDNTEQDLSNRVTWVSSDEQIASISNASDSPGLLTALQQGQVKISVRMPGLPDSLPDGTSSALSASVNVTNAQLLSIALTPANPDVTSVVKGESAAFVATGVYTDNSTQDLTLSALWRSTDERIATVSNDDSEGFKGTVRDAGVGTTTLSASIGTMVGSTPITVSPATLVSVQVVTDAAADTGQLPKGLSQRFNLDSAVERARETCF